MGSGVSKLLCWDLVYVWFVLRVLSYFSAREFIARWSVFHYITQLRLMKTTLEYASKWSKHVVFCTDVLVYVTLARVYEMVLVLRSLIVSV